MALDLLPVRSSSAAENMATDFLLLQRYPRSQNARFRHYGWHRPAFTFGYSQKIAFVREQLPRGEPVEICRRPTGGGVVDHRNDWTFALVVPRGHALEEARALASYRVVHATLAETLRSLDQPVILNETVESSADNDRGGPGVCFVKPELYDVLNKKNGRKVAGAAQKRNKHGLLFQGSIDRAALEAQLDWDTFYQAFTKRLADALALPVQETGWPEFAEEELTGLVDQYGSSEWNEYR
jgi:lipoate-protein ligase A